MWEIDHNASGHVLNVAFLNLETNVEGVNSK